MCESHILFVICLGAIQRTYPDETQYTIGKYVSRYLAQVGDTEGGRANRRRRQLSASAE